MSEFTRGQLVELRRETADGEHACYAIYEGDDHSEQWPIELSATNYMGEWHSARGAWEREGVVPVPPGPEYDRVWASYCAWQLAGNDELGGSN